MEYFFQYCCVSAGEIVENVVQDISSKWWNRLTIETVSLINE